MIDRMRERIENKIAEAELEYSPFPHLIVENFFPDDVFARILDYNPFRKNRGSEWMDRAASRTVASRTPYYARKQINFHKSDEFAADEEEKRFWDALKRCFLADHWFETLVMRKFPAYFRLRFGSVADDPDFPSMFNKELFLQRHEPGYYIGPHTDIPTRVFTCIFAFADRPGFEDYGTQLLEPKDRLTRCWGNDHYAPDDFVVKKVAPYTPNNFLLFFKTRHSFHAVRAIDDAVPNQRYGMQFQFYEPEGGLFRDLSAPDLMVIKRPGHRNRLRRAVARLRPNAS